jgi:hypothetical protein
MRIGLAILCLVLAGCATRAPMPPVDLKAPGWQVRRGQAVWKPGAKKPEIAGDVILATNPNGNSFVQFSKTLPLVTAQKSPKGWQADFPPEDKHYSGGGTGPKRIVWLQLLNAIEGRRPDQYWRLVHPSDNFIALENDERGERLEVHFQN